MIEQDIHRAINPIIVQLGYEIVDIEYKNIRGDMHLTIFCDCASGMSLDDCEKINSAVDDILEQLNPTNDKPYILNISSPGLDRPFKTARDYARNLGKEIEVNLFNHIDKKLKFDGKLLSHNEKEIIIMTRKGEIVISMDNIKFSTPLVKFS
ncbi:MAG: ribosome maturation factor RimP [Clostridiales bacterium]|jgi:ribosome maturation factor RimP|nr:ribosome maturation factor RimP [Clostridiales bacterium]